MDVLISPFATFQGVLPVLFGSLTALWKRGTKIDSDASIKDRVFALLILVFALLISIVLGKWIGGAIVAKFSVNSVVATYLIEFFSGLSSLKVVDGVIASVDASIKVVVEKSPQVVSAFFDGVIDQIKNIFK